MKKFFSFALFLGLAFGLNTAISAQVSNSQSAPNAQEKMGRKNKAGKMRGDKGGRAMGGLNRLNLSDAQKQQIQNIRQNNQAGDVVRAEMRELMQARRGGGSLTAEQTARLKTLRQQSKVNRENLQQQIMAILTPEQRQQWEQNKEDGKQRRKNKQDQGSPQDF